MRIGPLSHAAALCDDVATVDCFCTDIGRIPGTEKTCAEGGVFGLSRKGLLNLCTFKRSLASSRERVAT